MKYRRIPIKRLFEVSENLADLEARLAKNGMTFSDPKELHDFLNWNWMEANKDKIAEIRAQPLEPVSELPHNTVILKGRYDTDITVKIYGVIHGTTGLSLGYKIKRMVRKAAKKRQLSKEDASQIMAENWAREEKKYRSMMKTGEIFEYKDLPELKQTYYNHPRAPFLEEDYLLEPHFAKIFGLDKSHEIKFRVNSSLQAMSTKTKYAFLFRCIMNAFFLWPFKRISFKKKYPSVVSSMDNPEYLTRARAVLECMRLPSPIGPELKEKAGIGFYQYGIDMANRAALKADIEDVKSRGKFKTLNVIVGQGHETDMYEHLLKTPSTRPADVENSKQAFAKSTSLEKVCC